MDLFQFDTFFFKTLPWLKSGSCICNHSGQHSHITVIVECASMGQVCHTQGLR